LKKKLEARKKRCCHEPVVKGTVWLSVLIMALVWMGEGKARENERPYEVSRRDKLFSCHFVDRNVGLVVGNRGLVLRTTDRGESWNRIEIEAREALNGITCVGNHGWIVGSNGLIMHSDDSGASWGTQKSGSADSLMAVHFFNQKRGIVVGGGGTILTTNNGGTTWHRYPFDWMGSLPPCAIEMCILSPILYDIYFLDTRHGWIVGEKGTVLATKDGGTEWKLLNVAEYPSLYSVYFSNEHEGMAAGKDGSLLTSNDGGSTWEKQRVPVPAGEVDLHVVLMDDGRGIVVGDRGVVLRSTDGGKNWKLETLQLQPPLPWLVGACVIPENSAKQGCIVGEGTIVNLAIEEVKREE